MAAAAQGLFTALVSDIIMVVSTAATAATMPLFLSSAIMGINDHMPRVATAGARVWAGQGDTIDPTGGRVPGIAFWNVNGRYLGDSGGKGSHVIQSGNFHDIAVEFGGSNEPPDYMSVSAQSSDAICISGIFVKWPVSEGKAVFMASIGAACGMPWFPSRVPIVPNQKELPVCVWIDGSGKSKDRITHPESHGNVNDPPAGFSYHLPDFSDANVNEDTLKQYQNNTAFVCGHEARFKVWDDMRGKFSIPIFTEKPLKRGVNGTDTNDFMSKAIELSEPLKHYVSGKRDLHSVASKRDLSNLEGDGHEETHEAVAKRKQRLLHQTLVKNKFPASALCDSKTSWGPDFFSYEENQLCHMATKTLIPACSSDVKGECFDPNSNEIKHESQALFSRTRPRNQVMAKKQYVRIEDGMDPNMVLLF